MEKIKITDNSVIEQIRGNMATATISEKGLMPAGLIGSKNDQSSTLICETTTNAVTGSLLLAVSATTSLFYHNKRDIILVFNALN